MCKSARTVITLWLDHVHRPRKENLLHQALRCYLGQNSCRSLRRGLFCQETAANDFRFILLHFFRAPQLVVTLSNRKCFALQLNITVLPPCPTPPTTSLVSSREARWTEPAGCPAQCPMPHSLHPEDFGPYTFTSV